MADEVNDIFSGGASEPAPPDFNDMFGAFERTREADEQAINRAVERSDAYQFTPVEGYTPYDDPRADQDLVDRYLPRFLDVRSPDACRALEYKLKREESEAELVRSSGWMGAVAAASIGRPALATWTPGRPEYVNGELRYRPGHATLGYGFPDIGSAIFDGGSGSSSAGGGGDEDTRDEFYEGYYAKPGEKHPILRLIVRPWWVKLPEREGPDGNGKPDTAPKQFRLYRDEKSAVAPDNEAEQPTAQKPDGETEPSFTLPHIDLPRIELPKQPAANLPQGRSENPTPETKGSERSSAESPAAEQPHAERPNPAGSATPAPLPSKYSSGTGERRVASDRRPVGEMEVGNAVTPHEIPAPDTFESLTGQEPRQSRPDAPERAPDKPAHEPLSAKGNASRLGWVGQYKLSQTVAEYSSIEGAGRLYRLATVAKWLEENPDASDTDLLTEFNPGLLRIRWVERRQAMIDYLRSASTLLEDVRQKQAEYEAMESSGSIGDFTAWLAGQVTGGWRSPENWVGGAGKGASLFGRALWTGLKQAGIAAGSDAVAQWLLIKTGFQKEFDPVQTVATAATSGAFGAAGKAGGDGVKLGISAKSGPPPGKAAAADPSIGHITEPAKRAPTPDLSSVADPPDLNKLTRKEREVDLERRNAGVTELAKEYPVSVNYEKARVGEVGPSDYAKTFRRENPHVGDEVEVHHAVEQRVLDMYPGLFEKEQINSVENLRGIPKEIKSSLHRSLIRKEWDVFYKRHEKRPPTFYEVLEHATMIDRKFGGLFKPPL